MAHGSVSSCVRLEQGWLLDTEELSRRGARPLETLLGVTRKAIAICYNSNTDSSLN